MHVKNQSARGFWEKVPLQVQGWDWGNHFRVAKIGGIFSIWALEVPGMDGPTWVGALNPLSYHSKVWNVLWQDSCLPFKQCDFSPCLLCLFFFPNFNNLLFHKMLLNCNKGSDKVKIQRLRLVSWHSSLQSSTSFFFAKDKVDGVDNINDIVAFWAKRTVYFGITWIAFSK